MELIPGFRWPLLKEFSTAVNLCRFERGDIIYDDPDAYFLPWKEAVQKLGIALQVKAPERAKATPGDDESICEANWTSPVTIEITDHKTASPTTTVEYKQGNLYTALRQGDLGYLRAALPQWNDLVKWLRNEAKTGALSFSPLNKLIAELDCSHVFILPHGNQSPITRKKVAELREELSAECKIKTGRIKLTEILEPRYQLYAPTTSISLFGIKTSKNGWSRGKFLDGLKRVLYEPDLKKQGACGRCSLSSYGVLWERTPPTEKGLVTRSFFHRGHPYRLRYSTARCEEVDPLLADFIRSIYDDCPNAEFNRSTRCSKLKKKYSLKASETKCQQGELTDLLFQCPTEMTFKSRHEHVQKYFLNNDRKTVACEVPVWVTCDEDPILEQLIRIEATDLFPTLTGHIDLIRFFNGLIWVWDYKPDAMAESCASEQVYLYARMLACRTKIPLDHFRCGYFGPGLEISFDPSHTSIAC